MGKRPTLTATGGDPVADNQNAVAAGAHRPVLLRIVKAPAMSDVPVIALCLLAIVTPAQAGTPPDLPAPPMAESLDAMRHHQPTNEYVLQREAERNGRQQVEEQQHREKSEVDQLYDDVMRFSAPVASDPPLKPR